MNNNNKEKDGDFAPKDPMNNPNEETKRNPRNNNQLRYLPNSW